MMILLSGQSDLHQRYMKLSQHLGELFQIHRLNAPHVRKFCELIDVVTDATQLV